MESAAIDPSGPPLTPPASGRGLAPVVMNGHALAWCWLRIRSRARAAACIAVHEVLATDPLFGARARLDGGEWRIERAGRKRAAPIATIDARGLRGADAARLISRLSHRLHGMTTMAGSGVSGGMEPRMPSLKTRAAILWIDDEQRVCWTMPAVLSDRRTMRVAASRIANALASGERPRAARPAPADYFRFLDWRDTFLNDSAAQPMRSPWRIPPVSPSPPRSDRRPSRARRTLDRALCERLQSRAHELASRVEIVAGAAWCLHLAGEDSEPARAPETPVIGWTVHGRFVPALRAAPGCFARTLPLTPPSLDGAFADLVASLDGQVTLAEAHVEYAADIAQAAMPFGFAADLVEDDEIAGDVDEAPASSSVRMRAPLVEVLDIVTPEPRCGIRLSLVRRLADDDDAASGADRRGGFDLHLDYDAAATPRWRAESLLAGYVDCLRRCLGDPWREAAALAGPSDAQRHALLTEWQGVWSGADGSTMEARSDAPPRETGGAVWMAPEGAPRAVLDRLRTACREHGERVALVSPEGVWTYDWLWRRAETIAQRLRRIDGGGSLRGARVLIVLDRGPDAIAAMIGTLLAGAAYVPASPGYPRDRLAAIVADCTPRVRVVATRSIADADDEMAFEGVTLAIDELIAGDASDGHPTDDPARDDPAYVLYTSGSTARPRGVVITHANLSASLDARLATYPPDTRRAAGADAPGYLLASPLVFDSSVAGIYWTLASGGRLVLPPERLHDRFDDMLTLLRAGRVTHLLALPSLYRMLLDRAESDTRAQLETVILAGEPLSADTAAHHWAHAPRAALYNEYGLTEVSVWSTVHRVPPPAARRRAAPAGAGGVSIGRPIPGARVYVLTSDLRPCRPGREGDLHLGGPMVSPSYWRLPAESAAKFVPDPFSGVPGARMCRTGDRARWRADGQLEFLGRADRQVKVRGVRFELDELEQVLRAQPVIADAAAIAIADRGSTQLHAFVVTAPGVDDDDVWRHSVARALRAVLPPQLLPIPVTRLSALPRTASGKIDRAPLAARVRDAVRAVDAEVNGSADSGTQVLSASAIGMDHEPLLTLIAGVWQAHLGARAIDASSSFWEIGGDSILAMPVIADLRRMFGAGVSVGLRDLFEAPTLAAFTRRAAAALREAKAGRDAEPSSAAPAAAPVPHAAADALALTPMSDTSAGADADAASVGVRVPLSFAQQRLWLLQRMQPGSAAYHCPLALRTDGPASVILWEQTFALVARRQHSLSAIVGGIRGAGAPSTATATSTSTPTSTSTGISTSRLKAGGSRCGVVELSGLAPEARERAWRRLLAGDAARPFALDRDVAWRQRFVIFDRRAGDRTGRRSSRPPGAPGRGGISLCFHHLICDAASMEILARDIASAAPVIASGRGHAFAPLAVTYPDFARWQRERLSPARGAGLVERWRALLGPSVSAPEIPTDAPRTHASGRGARLTIELDGARAERIAAAARDAGATPFLVLLAACQAFVSGASGAEHVCVGVPVANRAWPGADAIVGLLLDLLPVPLRVGHTGARGLIAAARASFLTAHALQELPFERLAEALAPAREPGRHPVFQVFFTYHAGAADTELPLGAARARVEQAPLRDVKFDLAINVVARRGRFDVTFEYDRDLFRRATIRRFAAAYRHLIDRVCGDPSRPITRGDLLPAAVRHAVLTEWNETARDWPPPPAPAPAPETLPAWWRAAAAHHPDRVALADNGGALTFAALDRWSDAIAAGLIRRGLAPGEPVGILLPRSARAIAAMLGVMKAALIVVPLDPEAPPARLDQAAARLGMRLVIGDAPGRRAAAVARPAFRTTGVTPCPDASANPPLRQQASSRRCEAAYILFTSGSSDQPKAVLGSHRALLNRFRWMWDAMPFAAGEVCCARTPLTFVDSLWELFGGLLQGVPLIVFDELTVRDPRALARALQTHDISRIVLIPSMLKLLLERLPDGLAGLPALRLVTVSGEPLDPSTCRLFARAPGGAALLNLYGMTEAAADATWHLPLDPAHAYRTAPERANVPIGRPIANIDACLLDRALQPVGIGVPAELYIGGAGLAEGYWRAPEATAARFVPHPFARTPGARLYRTGDIGVWRPDGRLLCLGRADRQIKIRGMRVEPLEIEEALHRLPEVAQAVVRGLPAPSGVRLAAYVLLREPVAAARRATDEELVAIRRRLAATLPAHMLPPDVVFVAALPINTSGKIDARALPAPSDLDAGPIAGANPNAPVAARAGGMSELEERIERIWRGVIGAGDAAAREPIPVERNFFDAGGDSFALLQMQDRLRSALGIDVDVIDLLAHATIRELAAFIGGAGKHAAAAEAEAIEARAARRRGALTGAGRKGR